MPWSGWSYENAQLLKAKEQAEAQIEQEYGIAYDFDLMEYVDEHGDVVSGDRVSQIRRELMGEKGYHL